MHSNPAAFLSAALALDFRSVSGSSRVRALCLLFPREAAAPFFRFREPFRTDPLLPESRAVADAKQGAVIDVGEGGSRVCGFRYVLCGFGGLMLQSYNYIHF